MTMPPYGPPHGAPQGQPYGQQPAWQQPGHQPPYYPPPPPQPYSGMPPGPPRPPQKKKSRLGLILAIAAVLLIVVIAAVVLVVYLAVGRGTVTATQVKMGDCLSEIPDSSRVLTVKTVGCDQPHAGEVFAVLTMPEGDYPGDAAVQEYSERCSPALAAYAPAAMDDDTVQLYVLYPTGETWGQGDRAVTCVATLDPPRAGSLKG